MQNTINPYPLAIKIQYKLSKDQQIVNSPKRTPKSRSPSNKENMNPNNEYQLAKRSKTRKYRGPKARVSLGVGTKYTREGSLSKEVLPF
jgi:hypothetical protein